ncbi:MAG: zinc ribbon domain-containing protein [Chthonomonadales bacterium]|nr:zinc ribbon domain-containing protein [Chthonomonadales bacterium]
MRKDTAGACQHCGALVYAETRRCPQCGRFPVKLRLCAHCRHIAPADAARCPRCGRPFQPDGDYL